MDEANLIQGCINGERHCQKRLYDLYASTMYAVCVRYATDRGEAEDILQEGFIRVFGGIAGYHPTGPFGGWVRRIFVNTAIEHYRRAKRNIVSHPEVMPDPGKEDVNIIEKIEIQQLINLINCLPDGYKQVFNLYAVEGYKHHEIATMLGISEGTSKSQYSRARKQLQDMMAEQHIETGYHAAQGNI